MKYKVTVYHEQYTDYLVEAESEDKATDLVLSGEYDEIDDTTVKHSEVMGVETI